MENSFTNQDYAVAAKSFSEWQCKQDETIDEYLLRKRQIELNALVNKVIDEELSEKDKLLLRLHWYEEKTIAEVATILKVNKTNVYRNLDKITDTIYEKLKYAVEYRYGSDYSKSIRPVIKSKGAFFYTPKAKGVADRLRNLRLRQCLTAEDIFTLTGITPVRLGRLEKGDGTPDFEELVKLSELYHESCDYIVFGHRQQ